MINDVEARYRAIFELAPVSFWVEDFTDAAAMLEAMKAEGVQDFRAHFAAHPEILTELARKIRVIEVNEISPVMFGARSKEELLGSLDRVFLPETYPVFLEEMVALARGERSFASEAVTGTLDGHRIDVLVQLVLLPVEKNGTTHALVTLLDITQIKAAERDSRAQEKQQRTLLESIPHMVWLGDAHGRITYCNQAMRQATRLTVAQIQGRDWIDVVHPDDIGEIRALRAAAHQHGRSYRGEARFRAADGSHRAVQYIKTPVHDEHGEVVQWVGISTDITELKAAREKLQGSLERSNRELAQIAHAASHDLQEPLRMISSYADLLQRRQAGVADEKTSRYTAYMVEGADRIRQLIDDLATLSSISTEDREPTQVPTRAVLTAAVAAMQPELAACGGQILYGHLPDVMADQRQLTQLFRHLIDNSLKFRSAKPPRIEISMRRDGPMQLFAVKDNGIGFDGAKYGERVFGMFQRLHARDQYPGTGIGLPLARKIVERNGGRIWVESQPDEGTTIFFTVPALPAELVDSGDTQPPTTR
ncbi:MAG TPA: PAS domain S-box protein [Haliangium sp.]|nr:PAS domain S-box protein [Haliangium sp.]